MSTEHTRWPNDRPQRTAAGHRKLACLGIILAVILGAGTVMYYPLGPAPGPGERGSAGCLIGCFRAFHQTMQ
jgi:hypothetical protein